ncbi:MAG: BcsE family c-di-GMP-binding protein, partial [Pseudomonas sp.]|nr:BcsE family c-di-GMP-binding protein [Pseudomonas sp.]
VSQVTLSIRYLRDEQMLLHQGGLYWLSIDQVGDAEVLGRQFLGALEKVRSATLVCCAQDPRQIVAKLDKRLGPFELRLFEVTEADIRLALKSLPLELNRAAVARGSPIVLILPVVSWQGFGILHLQRWCENMAIWLRQRACTLLVLCHGQAPTLHADLIRLNERLSGLAQLYRRDGGIRYQLNYWHSYLGVCSAQEFELDAQPDGFGLTQIERSNPQPTRTEDQRLYLTLRSVLEGAPPLSQQWHLFENYDDLFFEASRVRAATVIVGVTSNLQVEALAQQLYDLRERCGTSLKIIVRELVSCLRYRDERLLVSCGANITVPHGTSLAYFFSLVDSVQGQIWRHSRTIDFKALLERLRPPVERGVLSPHSFIATLDQVYDGAAGEVSHQLLKLQPRNDLSIEQYIDQINLRRFGDIACVLDGAFFLFLFACRADGVAPALGKICRLPWHDLFSECQFFSGVDGLPRQAFLDAQNTPESVYLAATTTDAGSVSNSQQHAYAPQRTTLPVTEYCP